MTPLRFRVILISMLSLIIVGGALWFSFTAAPTQPSFGPELGKLQAGQPPAPESIGTPRTEQLSDRVAEYHMDVTLNESTRTLSGSESVTWTHPGTKPVSELYFHLYPNAFESADTTFMKESGGRLRGDSMPKDGWGSMKLTEVRTTDGISLLHRLQYVQPDDGNLKDRTLVKIRLPRPIQGGESTTLRINFEVQLPKIFARMGTAGDFVMAGQWFPKLSVYEPAGTRGRASEGWNLHQYHGSSEFYSDFGIFSVRINVPSSYIVAATGFPTKSPVIKANRKIYQYYADDVHDFAWSASPNFVYAEEPFSSPEVPGVRIKLYLDPAHKNLKDRYFYAAKAALSSYSKWYGRYPYSTLSIVVPPASGNGAGGMEYPTLVTAFGASSESPGYELERTVVHEIGHQYFYGMIASNEFEEAWLDEGFTSYAEDKLMESAYGVTSTLPIQSSFVNQPAALPKEAWKYGSADVYAQNVYTRGKLVLLGIERQVGTPVMNKIMAKYAAKFRFKHPATVDFQRTVEQVTGRSWKDYFNQYVYSGQMANFAVDSITVSPITPKDQSGPLYESVVKISRLGGTYPEVPVIFSFKDGHIVRKTWKGDESQIVYKLQYKQPLAWAMVDPGYTLVLENKHINNYLKSEVEEKTGTRWNLGITKVVESLLGLLSW
ncbi:M1 family metallopeptidase [Paenibacillus tuaregi]|uniref:M1 family metallopeptidase n=1 Tax=Paenibacillus tuaregi TaxID=1816681 RepID=UPI000837E02B|nr:M1 family metallopeptidase [Paenibacillus tuaregi]